MKLFAKLIAPPILLLLLVFTGALLLAVENTPILQGRADMTPEKIARGKQVFEQNDPRRLQSGSIAKANLDQEELDLAINYFANQYVDGIAGLEIDNGRAIIEGTLKLPVNPLGRFLNLKLELKQTDKLPEIDHVTLGKLRIPGVMAVFLIKTGFEAVEPRFDLQKIDHMIEHVKFEHRRMTIAYRWQGDLPAKLSDALFSAQDHTLIEAYQRRLAELSEDGKNSFDLTELLNPLFQLAKQRNNKGAAVAENRAAILVLTFYVNRIPLDKAIPQAITWGRPIWRTVTLNGRDDFPKHYLVSAMLAAYAGTPLADAVGLYKEIEDSRGGSGFSFNDIAADRAGTRMGELAIGNESRAKQIQQLLASAKDRDIMPVTADLPEFMPEAVFKRRFGGTQGEPYRRMMAEIERRVAALPVNRD